MITKHQVEGYDSFIEFMKNLDAKNKPVYVYFGGSKLPSGESWCDDCNRAAPVVEKALEKAPEDSIFVTCLVGPRSFWKDMNNPFRRDPKLRLMVVPAILKWGCPQRLDGDQCEKDELVEMLFTDEEQ